MKKYKTRKISETYIASITCDCCGESIDVHGQTISFTVDFGFSAKLFGDMETHNVDVCEKCYKNWIKTFKTAPDGFEELSFGQYISFEEWKNKQ